LKAPAAAHSSFFPPESKVRDIIPIIPVSEQTTMAAVAGDP